MANTETAPTRSRGQKQSPPSLYTQLFDRPALSVLKRAKRRASDYRDYLRERFGEGVPKRKVAAFELVYRIALRFPECWEDIYAAGKAGTEEGQERRTAAGVRR